MRADQILPDDVNQTEIGGVVVRKGTVGAFMHNARVWLDPAADAPARAEAEADLIAALPAVRALGVFDLFELRDARLKALAAAR